LDEDWCRFPCGLLERAQEDAVEEHADLQRVGGIVCDAGADDRNHTSGEIDGAAELLFRLDQDVGIEPERVVAVNGLGDERRVTGEGTRERC
jgi:hypothetical protein